MLPLIRLVLSRLEAAAAAGGSTERVAIYSGHDTVIAPVLAALGAFDAPQLCRWPPYASHIVLEVWDDSATGGPAAHGQYVRVLFNGTPITRRLRGCRDAKRSRGRDVAADEDDLCPLAILADAVRDLGEEYRRECGAVPSQ